MSALAALRDHLQDGISAHVHELMPRLLALLHESSVLGEDGSRSLCAGRIFQFSELRFCVKDSISPWFSSNYLAFQA